MNDPKVVPAEQATTLRRAIVLLVVDDQPFVGAALRLLLQSETDIELHSCLKAANAVDMALRVRPTLILQDLVMPDIDGLALVHAFKCNPLTVATPIVVLSGNDDAKSRAGALAAGATAFLVKLPPKAELIACIREHTSRHVARADTALPL
jgi:PleD family two-component response regulator